MRKLIYVAIVFAGLSFSGCSLNKMVQMAQDQQLTVTPNPLEVHADTVKFEMSANLPVKMLKAGKVYTIKTFYKYGNQELPLEDVVFKADDYPNSDQTQPKITQSFAFAYQPAMKTGSVEIKGVASDPRNGKSKETPRMGIADGIITTSQLVQEVYYPAFASHGYNNKEELIPTNINFYFDQGRSNLKYSERRSDRAKEFEAYIADKNQTKTVTITGTHSPEGPERINSRLSQDRATVIEKYYRKQMDKYDYKGMADSIKFILKPIVDDWGNFKVALADYDGISDDQKSEILNIINGPGAFEDQQNAVEKLSTYKKVFKDLYPGLRSAKTDILTIKDKKTDAEISVLAKQVAAGSTSADTLSLEELMYAASLTPSLSEKEGIYKAAIKKSDAWNAHANLGAVYIAMAMEDDANASNLANQAETQLDLANKAHPSAEAYTTAASVYLIQGNMNKASDALAKASAMNPDAETVNGLKGVRGAIEIRKADYGRAVSSLSGSKQTADNMFNKGLAYLLQKDYDNAINAFSEATELDGNFAIAYYGAAVANARKSNTSKVVENLGKAISNDASLKEAAVVDLEFKNVKTNPDFAALLK